MGNQDFVYPTATNVECAHRVNVPPRRPFSKNLKSNLKETFFPDDPFRQFKNQSGWQKLVSWLQYMLPILEWAPRYSFSFFKSDVIAGITIASLAIPQGISYAKLANLPPILGLYSSFVPPLVYAMMGSSKDLAVGTVAVGSLLMASMLGKTVSAHENPKLYLHLAFTATFFAGILQATLGVLRLGFIIDFLSHATIEGFMAGAAIVVCLQQLKGILGLEHFTAETDLISVMRSVFSQRHKWRWETAVLGCSFLFLLLLARYISKRRPRLFWISAAAPLMSVILGSLLVYLTKAENHGVQVIGHLQKGLNPLSVSDFTFTSPHFMTALKTGIVIGIIALAEGIAVGRSFAAFKNYHIDGNKEMIAFGMMNIAGSCTSCYLTAGPFSRSAVNFNAGCKTAVSNMVMAMAVMITLLFLTPLFHYTPLVVLSSIIVAAMLGLLKYESAIHLWKVDKVDFCVCMGAFLGVIFASVEVGLSIAVGISLLRLLLFVARPRTSALGNIPNSMIYRSVDQYPDATSTPGILILQIDAPIYFANTSYLRERISRWMDEEEDRLKKSMGDTSSLQYVILDMTAVGGIDTSGIDMLSEVKKNVDRRGLKLVLANPGSEVMEKLDRSRFIELIGQEWIYLTVGEAVGACNFMLHTCKPGNGMTNTEARESISQLQKSLCGGHFETQLKRLGDEVVENGGGGAWDYLCLVRKLKVRHSHNVLKYYGLPIAKDPNLRSKLGNHEWTLYEQVAISAMDCQHFDVAKDCLRSLRSKFPESTRVARLEGMLLEAKGSWAEAKKAYAHLLEDNPLDQFDELAVVHEVLSDPAKRNIYDQYGEDALKEGMGGGGGHHHPFHVFQSLLQSTFYEGNPFAVNCAGSVSSQGQRKRMGEDVILPLQVSLEELYNGTLKKLSFSRNVICSKCKGKGSKSSAPMACGGCQGSGMKASICNLGPSMIQQMQHLCNECKGTGETISDRDWCLHCKGEKAVREKKCLKL